MIYVVAMLKLSCCLIHVRLVHSALQKCADEPSHFLVWGNVFCFCIIVFNSPGFFSDFAQSCFSDFVRLLFETIFAFGIESILCQ